MGDRLVRKGLVVGIILLFIGTTFTPNIIAVDLSKYNSIELNNNIVLSASEISKNSPLIKIVDLVPYEYYESSPDVYDLCVTCEIKNVGNEQYTESVGYSAVSINMYTRQQEGPSMRCTKSGGLLPGESWCPERGYGARFETHLFPTFFLLKFVSIPETSSALAIYLVWGWLFGQHCIELCVIYH